VPSTLGVVASQVFTPLDLSPALWLDAADTSTITASGSSVSQWNDKSGNARHFIQSTAASQPTTGTATLNGRNVLVFASDFMRADTTAATWTFLHNGTDHLIAVVFKAGTSSNPNAVYGILGTNNTSNLGVALTWDDRSSVPRNNNITMQVRNATANVVVNSSDDALAGNTFGVVTMLTDPDNATAADRSKIYVGSGSVIANNTASASPSTNTQSSVAAIGATNQTPTLPMTGQIAEVVIVSGANATEANRLLLRDYLAAKWGI
jgi:hypothetical protein